MLSVISAFEKIMGQIKPLKQIDSNITYLKPSYQLVGRILATDLYAQYNLPQLPLSAMDGYAIRAEDTKLASKQQPKLLQVIGISQAGKNFPKTIQPNQAVKIFTGAVIPKGSNAIAINEIVQIASNSNDVASTEIFVDRIVPNNLYIRPSGLDVKKGQLLLACNKKITSRDLALILATGQKKIAIQRKPEIAILSTGDELVELHPNSKLKPYQIYSSNSQVLASMIINWGGIPKILPSAPDQLPRLKQLLKKAAESDFIVTTGGASIGDKDFIRQGLDELKGILEFWKLAMRPGKPIIFGHILGTPLLGLPGNPVSVTIGAWVFLNAIMQRMQHQPVQFFDQKATLKRLAIDLPANNDRQEYMRAIEIPMDIEISKHNSPNNFILNRETMVRPQPSQDSSQLYLLAKSNGVIIRKAHDPMRKKGEMVAYVPFPPLL